MLANDRDLLVLTDEDGVVLNGESEEQVRPRSHPTAEAVFVTNRFVRAA